MIERELEVVDGAAEEASDLAVVLADLRDEADGKSATEIKELLAGVIERINNVADVLTALSIDLARVNNNLNDRRRSETGLDARH